MKRRYLGVAFASIPLFSQAQVFPTGNPEAWTFVFTIIGIEADVAKCSDEYPYLAAGISTAFEKMKQRNAATVPLKIWESDTLKRKQLSEALYKDHIPAPTEQDCKARAVYWSSDEFVQKFQALAKQAQALRAHKHP